MIIWSLIGLSGMIIYYIAAWSHFKQSNWLDNFATLIIGTACGALTFVGSLIYATYKLIDLCKK